VFDSGDHESHDENPPSLSPRISAGEASRTTSQSDASTVGVADNPGGRTLVSVTATLSVLATSAPTQADPVQALAAPEMLALIDRARSRYDWVLIDSPPAALVPDPNVLARLADGVLFVIWTATTPFDAIRRGVSAVGKERIIGVVLNRAPADMTDGSFKYYDRYYEDYSATV
jgi:Mrp family chromosome partitioning ATPase